MKTVSLTFHRDDVDLIMSELDRNTPAAQHMARRDSGVFAMFQWLSVTGNTDTATGDYNKDRVKIVDVPMDLAIIYIGSFVFMANELNDQRWLEMAARTSPQVTLQVVKLYSEFQVEQQEKKQKEKDKIREN